MRNNQGWGNGAPIGTSPNQGVGGHDGSAAAGGDAVGDDEDEPGGDDKPPGKQRADNDGKPLGFQGPRQGNPTPHRQLESGRVAY